MNGSRPAGSSAAFQRVLAALLCLAGAGCSRPPPYSSPAGTVDSRPVPAFGDPYLDMPPQPGGAPFDPDEGRGVQAFADRMIGAHVADFAVHHIVYSVFHGDLHFFYPAARAGPGPGLCEARVYLANGEPGSGPLGNWQGQVFAVAGSVAPLPNPPPPGYAGRLDAACRARLDMGLWYEAPAGKAYQAARLADSVVASARQSGALPIELRCRPFPSGVPEPPRCLGDVRKTVASIHPRAIVRVEDCLEKAQLPCLTVGIAMSPERGQAAAENQWMLSIQYRGGDQPRIVRVDVDDAYINFE